MTNKKAVVVRVGIDVGASELVAVIRKNGMTLKAQSFANTAADHVRLIRKLASYSDLIVCLEATGLYHLDLAVALHDAGLSVMVLNPKVSHNFAKVLRKNSKTDAVDADTLAQYAERMPYQAWTRPDNAVLRAAPVRPAYQRPHTSESHGQKPAACAVGDRGALPRRWRVTWPWRSRNSKRASRS